MNTDEGLEIVLTPVQLAAILEEETIEESGSLSNRLWGGATLVAGAIELIGAGALFLIPEPTTVTKIAGGALGVHGLDTASTGILQIVSGRTRTTMTSQAASTVAIILGADDKAASNVGMAVDIAVPLVTGFVGLARALAIRGGAISLVAEKAAGGHTIVRHVGRTEVELRARLAAQPRIPVASTFRTLKDAERYVAEALRVTQQPPAKSWWVSITD